MKSEEEIKAELKSLEGLIQAEYKRGSKPYMLSACKAALRWVIEENVGENMSPTDMWSIIMNMVDKELGEEEKRN